MNDNAPLTPPVVLVMDRDPFIQSDIDMTLHEVMPDAMVHLCSDTAAAASLIDTLEPLSLAVLRLMRHDRLDPRLPRRAAARGARVLLLGDPIDLGKGDGSEAQIADDRIAVLPVPFSAGTFRAALAELGFPAFS
ncbi:hypothetical protein [Mangrovicoccus algicola]|uniref:Uncharacterized protein n=1 Tax=Mangrovicoccus algicola TaxID=2771008 RepID=A0A8J6Z602_9RHOB|nr:hypothetical protein [Mangrovicoccus algicola]MBE3638409.1 hypothetical protein [Mangrovicoccus algicola]